jgi:hypothetical protein
MSIAGDYSFRGREAQIVLRWEKGKVEAGGLCIGSVLVRNSELLHCFLVLSL